ncbi:hypothetical protein OV207_19035 [Corallococcus sp. BB11-1]|uniref:hypothetical protein n=1 Tax=Corallococcus sp. BB11-1 TaxID=2996783 RepID=UPI0022717BB8|nr:hypothetical protein [Corallococcus sp. BB11-1]MCY1033554.1 hypothetical protein [Corallococcus sp. BB11-1]
MRRRTSLLSSGLALGCLAALGFSTPAMAEDEGSKHVLGLMVDAGAPHGIGVSAVLRPTQWLRLQAGPTTNTLSVGVRGGVSLLPLDTFIAPSLNAEVGHYFGSEYSDVLDWLGREPSTTSQAIRDVTYNYVTGSVGLEVGAHSRFNFFLHVGLSYVALTVPDPTPLIQDATNDDTVTSGPLHVRATIPSVKLGFILYFF